MPLELLPCLLQDAENQEEPVSLASNSGGPLVALAFKLEEGRYGQLTYMRIYSGTLRKGDNVVNVVNGKRVKVAENRCWSCCCTSLHWQPRGNLAVLVKMLLAKQDEGGAFRTSVILFA